MTKILLVEDDKSLQEIYGVRLTSEGYRVLIAGDGEEALNVALKEKPDLILSDVMMPKISGFDMLDILRTTPEIKDIKVIIMTALSSDDQRERGEKLGANLYLVKSQVGIEDVIQAVKNLLEAPEQTVVNQADPLTTPTAEISVEAEVTAQPAVEVTPLDNQTSSSDESLESNQDRPQIIMPKRQFATELSEQSDSGNVFLHSETSDTIEQPITPDSTLDQTTNQLPTTSPQPDLDNSSINNLHFKPIASTDQTPIDSVQPPTPSQPAPNELSINPKYRQPTSLRDLIPERDQTNGQ